MQLSCIPVSICNHIFESAHMQAA